MISHLKPTHFTALPWLETSTMCRNHPDGIPFSLDKPNVLIGPNGSGKSALMSALSLLTLSYYIGVSALDNHYIENDAFWSSAQYGGWRDDPVWLPGLDCVTDYAPAAFFRPGHIPGNRSMITEAMMSGYFSEARAYSVQIDNKSSGQQGWALLERMMSMLAGNETLPALKTANWSYTRALPEKQSDRSNADERAELLRTRYRTHGDGIPMILMDEPESSLDAKTEMTLWQHLARPVDGVQIVVATHSLWPILHPESFHLIETEPGYSDEVRILAAAEK